MKRQLAGHERHRLDQRVARKLDFFERVLIVWLEVKDIKPRGAVRASQARLIRDSSSHHFGTIAATASARTTAASTTQTTWQSNEVHEWWMSLVVLSVHPVCFGILRHRVFNDELHAFDVAEIRIHAHRAFVR